MELWFSFEDVKRIYELIVMLWKNPEFRSQYERIRAASIAGDIDKITKLMTMLYQKFSNIPFVDLSIAVSLLLAFERLKEEKELQKIIDRAEQESIYQGIM